MNFDDIIERIKAELKTTWDRLQEMNLFISIRESYEALSPSNQKLAVAGVISILALLLFMLPWGIYSTSMDNVVEFEERKQLLRDMLKVTRETSDTPDLPTPPAPITLRGSIENILASANLLEQQQGGIDIVSEESALIPSKFSQGLIKVSLRSLNVNQIVDIGFQLQGIGTGVKVKDLIIEASRQHTHYFDVIYNLAVLTGPPRPPETAEPETKPRPGRSRGSPKEED